MRHGCLLLQTEAELEAAFTLVQQLRPQLTVEQYRSRLRQQMERESFQAVGLFDQDELVAFGGFRIMTSLVHGKFVYVDDLVSDVNRRSRGYGGQMIAWIEEHARSQGCAQLHLDSGVQRHQAHRFYFRERFEIVYYHFKKQL